MSRAISNRKSQKYYRGNYRKSIRNLIKSMKILENPIKFSKNLRNQKSVVYNFTCITRESPLYNELRNR